MYLEGYKLAIWLCFSSLYILFNLYYFEYLHDVIYEAESALCNINKHHLQLRTIDCSGVLIFFVET
jgi:hypothetical protein